MKYKENLGKGLEHAKATETVKGEARQMYNMEIMLQLCDLPSPTGCQTTIEQYQTIRHSMFGTTKIYHEVYPRKYHEIS